MIPAPLYQNPTTYGKTPQIQAWEIIMCPTCAWPATDIIDVPDDQPGRTVKAQCGRDHTWTTTWSGKSTTIHRRPVASRSPFLSDKTDKDAS